MANVNFLQIIEKKDIGSESVLLRAKVLSENIVMTTGKYIFINTEIILPAGKALKKAYSILEFNEQTSEFTFAVQKIKDGLGSNFFHDVEIGRKLEFGGPYGKLKIDSIPKEKEGTHLLVSTDTGVSGALGLLNQKDYAKFLPNTHLVWLSENKDYYIGIEEIQKRLPSDLAKFSHFEAGNAFSDQRVIEDSFYFYLETLDLVSIITSGDGNLIWPLHNYGTENNLEENQMIFEYYFNRP